MKQYYYNYTFIGLFSLLGIFSSCNLINPAEPIPSYIHIETIKLTTDECVEGTNSSKITDAWVYLDDNLVGCFELPVTVPILAEGSHTLLIKAGIKVNGISATRAPYPFYKEYTSTINLSRGSVLPVSPTVTYVSGLNWTSLWNDTFDGSGMTILPPGSGYDTTMRWFHVPVSTLPHPDIYEATCILPSEEAGAGIASVDNTYTLSESTSPLLTGLPRGDSPVFLEFNYKSNYAFTIGMYEYATSGTTKEVALNVNPSASWNKMYLYLSPTINASGSATSYRIFFGLLNNIGADSLGFAIDNIKLIHY